MEPGGKPPSLFFFGGGGGQSTHANAETMRNPGNISSSQSINRQNESSTKTHTEGL